MRVLMQGRSNFFELKGGDTIQLLKTKEQLEKLGVEVDISLEWTPNLDKYDLVHLSNVTRIQETYLQMQNAKSQNKPVVLSTIFWPMDEFEKTGQFGVRKYINKHLSIDNIERVKALARFIKDRRSRNAATKNLIKIGYSAMQKYVVDNADYYLPNAELEMEELKKHFSLDSDRYIVVPNAVDISLVDNAINEKIPDEFLKYKDAVICVGRIETRKNQLALVEALMDSTYKLLIVGSVSNNQRKYFKKISRLIDQNPNFYYLPYIANEDIYKLYRVCKVEALPSWLDTPGLVNLEAAAMGCNLAISTRGTTKEYFKEHASYCEPDDLASIRKAVDDAFNKSSRSELKELIRKEYTWEMAAKKTLECYNKVLGYN